MPYTIRKNNNKYTYKVTITSTGRVVAYATKDPKKLIQAIEINKRKPFYTFAHLKRQS